MAALEEAEMEAAKPVKGYVLNWHGMTSVGFVVVEVCLFLFLVKVTTGPAQIQEGGEIGSFS